jgi:predicted metal-dependent phosphoesterase TrpH
MIFELHCHTHYSRGTKIPTEVMVSPRQVVRLARKAGIDGLAITDHRVVSGWREARGEARKQGIMFIPGMEVQTSQGHMIGLGLNEAVENFLTVDETLEGIREQGGFSVAPHPYDIKNDGVKDLCVKADAVEVFNSFGMDRIANWYTQRRVAKSGRPMVVGSDVHMPEMMGLSVNFADAQDMDGLFREIRKGRVGFRTSCVPTGAVVRWVRDRMNHSYADVLHYIEGNYRQPRAWISKGLLNSFVGSTGRAWNIVGRFAVGCSALYSGAKLLTY